MNRLARACTAAAIAAALVMPAVAQARDKAAGWAAWTERAERIHRALIEGQSPGLDSACRGVTGTVIGQGFQFPMWAQALIQVCTVTQAGLHGSENNRRSRQICDDLKRVSKSIDKATDVPEAPQAASVAHGIADAMRQYRDMLCVNFR